MNLPRRSSLQKLEEELKTVENRRAELVKLQEPITQEFRKTHNKMEVLKDKIGKLRLASSKVTDWELLLSENSGEVVYQRYDKELWKRGLYGGGVVIPTKQRCVKVKLLKNSQQSYNKTVKGLKEILPFIKPLVDGRYKGYKFVDVFESTLSQYGTYYLLINETKHIYRLMQSIYSRITELKRFKTLEELIKYVQEHHPYETK